MASDPRRLFDSKDVEAAALYAKRLASSEDFYPVLVNEDGSLLVTLTAGTVSIDTAGLATSVGQTTHTTLLTEISAAVRGQLTIGTVTLDTTASTINNAVGNPVNVSLSTTAATINNAVGNPVNVSLTNTAVSVSNAAGTFNVNIRTATLGTVTVTGTVTPSTTASTITNAVGNPVNVSLTSTAVTISNTAGTVTNSVSTIMIVGRTLTGSTGSLTATNGVITLTPTNRIKVYAISLTTTSATELICILNSGGVANGLELWRATLMAPAGSNAGLNLAVTPPNFLFASRSGTAVSLSLNTATLIHYSVSYFDEA